MSSPPSDDPPPESAPETIAGLRRLLADALRELSLQKTKKKRTREEAEFVATSRGVCKLVTLYDDLSELQREADRRGFQGEQTDDPRDQRRADRNIEAYRLLLRLMPQAREHIMDPKVDLEAYWAKIEDRARSARADDCRLIKERSASWLNAPPYSCKPPLDPFERNCRGLDNPCTCEQLFSIEYDFNDPEINAKVIANDPQCRLGDSFYFALLYPFHQGDPGDLEHLFLRSPLLLKTVCTIFTASKSVDRLKGADDAENIDPSPPQKRQKGNRGRATRSNVSKLTHMGNQITPRAIAYAAVMLHFNLTDASEWVEEYNTVSYPAFYNFIIDYFEVHDLATEEGRQAKKASDATLEWFNKRVFPRPPAQTGNGDASFSRLQAQRRAKAAAAASATAPSGL